DQYPGDTEIYGVSTQAIEPNVLIFLDNSGSMTGNVVSGTAYDPSVTYPVTNDCWWSACSSNKVYRWFYFSWLEHMSNVSSVSCSSAYTALTTSGTYQGQLNTDGTCSQTLASFATGNYINWLGTSGGLRPKIDVAKEVLENLILSTDGVRFGLMIFNSDNEGGHIAGIGDGYGYTEGGSDYHAYIKDMSDIFVGTTTNKTALIATINNVNADTWTPLAETLYEGLQYYEGDSVYFGGSGTYTTPIQYSCQQNYAIIITDGMSTLDRHSVLATLCTGGDCDGDGYEPGSDPTKSYSSDGSDYLDDVAKYLYDTDLLPDNGADVKTHGKQNVITHTIGFGLGGNASATELLEETAFNGGGVAYLASSTSDLSESLRQILATIVEDNTSYVAPVLPVSPENRTFSGSRLYMGFFKPQSGAFWYGNLKKYGLDSSGNILDKNGAAATNADGSIKDNAISYWSTAADGPDVAAGGVGGLLMSRATERNIYTYTGSSSALTDSSNAFTTTNTAITFSLMAVVDDTEKDSLINYVHGKDAYDDDGNGTTTEKRNWILGDILHSKPLVVNYNTYSLSAESDCSVNKTMVYVGGNDGMLHAYNDCDGSEAWAFIPQDQLPYLQNLPGSTHGYSVDSSPKPYIYDADGDGNIEAGDKAVLIFGERRGGNYYYAVDVTDPASPVYMWRLSATESPSTINTDYSELGESWSEPQIANISFQSSPSSPLETKVVAFIGGGYDNVNEDVNPALTNTKGRAIYAVEIATLSSGGVPSFSASGYKLWGYTSLTSSIPSDISVLDVDDNGFVDRAYVGDTGGNMWKLNMTDTQPSNWTVTKIFQGAAGSKIFYRPVVTLENGYEMLFFATGDRAHPTSTGMVDRLYAVKDTGQTSTTTETDLVDATSTNSVDITSAYGWYIQLSLNSGEKSLAPAAVISGIAYYTTYTPFISAGGSTDPCVVGNRGTA
ncbi:Type IV fimbrial biogenesis protein PilY1, partial [hydrothermal vent metagenome]